MQLTLVAYLLPTCLLIGQTFGNKWEMTTTVVNNSVFRMFFEKQRLTGPNFIDWYRNLRIVLSVEDNLPFLEQPIPAMPVLPAGQVLPPDVLNTHTAWVKASKEIDGLMLMNMEPNIQKNLEQLGAYDMLKELKTLYAQHAEQELLQTKFGTSRSCQTQEPCTEPSLVVSSARKYDSFVQNYNMHGMAKTVTELHAMIKLHEQTLPQKDRHLLLLNPRILQHPRRIICEERDLPTNVVKVGSLREKELFIISPRNAEKKKLLKEASTSYQGVRKLKARSFNLYWASNKRAKLNLDSTLLWQCRLGYISKKRIEKSQHDGLLDSTDIKSLKIENQLGKTIKSLHSDHGGEYMGQEFLDHLKEHGIIAHRTPPYTPQHNGVSERRNLTLLDMVRFMMSQITLPKSFWDYALESVARILNMVPTKKVEKTPYEVWHGQAPKLSYLKVWGCEALVKRDTLTKPDKLEPRSIKCIFVGYPKETMGYSFYCPPENKVIVARNAEFFENSLITQEASGSLEDLEIIQEEDTHPSIYTSLNHEEDDQEIDEPQSDINPIRKSSRTRHALDLMCLHVDAEEHKLGDLSEPANYKSALLDHESDKWLNAMNVEMQSMRDNEV
ncbi:retrotransposon protein, putative, ty1-copia subclass [Tanacetum coccineum]